MDKLDCVYDYFKATRAYYLFQFGIILNKEEYLQFILEKENINGAKVSFISNIMLGIKEDLINNKGANNYQSKIFINKLENLVNIIATKVPDGYKLSNYVFPDAATLVAIVRNKFAHGKYTIDFKHNRVILNHKGVDIIINIDKLTMFIMFGFMYSVFDVNTNVFERNLVYLVKEPEKLQTGKIKDLNDVRKIIKNYNCVKFKIESKEGMPIFKDYINYFNSFLEKFNFNPYQAVKSDYFKQMNDYFEKRNYKISIDYNKLNDKESIDKILKLVEEEVLNNENLTYEQQIKIIGMEIQRSVENKFNTFNPIAANISNLILLDAISKTKSIDREKISNYIANTLNTEVKFGYDEYGAVLLSMFNSLFVYPFDDVFETTGEYKLDREGCFDFSKLDLSMVKPIIDNIDTSPLDIVLEKRNSLIKKQDEITDKIKKQKINLNNVNNKEIVEKINNNIISLQKSLLLIQNQLSIVNIEYNDINNDYIVNNLHFVNKSIIEGIRNSIAHGNYEIISNGNIFDTKIVFNDIYEGKTTFKAELSFEDFGKMIDLNYNAVLNYEKNKVKVLKK